MTENTTYLLDEFVGVRLGVPYRLFPFGKIVKNGKVREITPEFAAQFKLPHFKPAIKLGSHDEPTPAGGHVIALEVRADGLYAVPEWNDAGDKAIKDGAYRYHSPEVIWGDGAIEDPATGNLIDGPLLIGDALLHTPHLGEAAKLYSIEPINKGEKQMNETIEIPKTFWETIVAKFAAQPNEPKEQPGQQPVVVAETDEYKAVVLERDDYKAKWEAHEASEARRVVVEKYEGELKEMKADPELAKIVADLPEENAVLLMRQLKAFSAQAALGAVEGEIGDSGQSAEVDPVTAFDAEIQRVQAEKKIDYAAALREVVSVAPELYEAYRQAKEK